MEEKAEPAGEDTMFKKGGRVLTMEEFKTVVDVWHSVVCRGSDEELDGLCMCYSF